MCLNIAGARLLNNNKQYCFLTLTEAQMHTGTSGAFLIQTQRKRAVCALFINLLCM